MQNWLSSNELNPLLHQLIKSHPHTSCLLNEELLRCRLLVKHKLIAYQTFDDILLLVILCKTSPTPVGRSPGFLSNGIKRQDRKASIVWASTISRVRDQYTVFGLHLQMPYRGHYLMFRNCWKLEFYASHWHPYLKGPEHLLVLIAALAFLCWFIGPWRDEYLVKYH